LSTDDHEVCPRCAATVGPHVANETGCVVCRDQRFGFCRVLRLGSYESKLRDVVLLLKHADGEPLADALGELWCESRSTQFRALGVDCVVPVPLHWLRRWQRGYNQAESLARSLARGLRLPCLSHCLWRTRYTPMQTSLTATLRRFNVKGVFQALPRPEIRGKTILLVDDVVTTCSTTSEAARALQEAGAREVFVATLARSIN
jgi:ComF family protein